MPQNLYTRTLDSTKFSCLIPVGVWLEWAFHLHANVVSLVLREDSEVGSKGREVQAGNLLIKVLGEEVDIILVFFGLLPVLQQIKLCESLVCERARHDE